MTASGQQPTCPAAGDRGFMTINLATEEPLARVAEVGAADADRTLG